MIIPSADKATADKMSRQGMAWATVSFVVLMCILLTVLMVLLAVGVIRGD